MSTDASSSPARDAWDGGTPRSRADALALLDALAATGQPTPTGRELGEWAGRTDRWGRSVLATWRDGSGDAESGRSGGLAARGQPTRSGPVPRPVPSPSVPVDAHGNTLAGGSGHTSSTAPTGGGQTEGDES